MLLLFVFEYLRRFLGLTVIVTVVIVLFLLFLIVISLPVCMVVGLGRLNRETHHAARLQNLAAAERILINMAVLALLVLLALLDVSLLFGRALITRLVILLVILVSKVLHSTFSSFLAFFPLHVAAKVFIVIFVVF